MRTGSPCVPQSLAPLDSAPAELFRATPVRALPAVIRDSGATRRRRAQPVGQGPAFRLVRKGLPHGRSRQSSEGPQRSGGLAKRVDGRDRPCAVNALRAKRGPYRVPPRIRLNPPTHVSGEPEIERIAREKRVSRLTLHASLNAERYQLPSLSTHLVTLSAHLTAQASERRVDRGQEHDGGPRRLSQAVASMLSPSSSVSAPVAVPLRAARVCSTSCCRFGRLSPEPLARSR